MKLDCPRREFFEAVNLAFAATTGRSPNMILQNLKLDANGAGVRLLGCDGEMWVERRLPCMTEEEGTLCVNAKLLQELVGAMPDGDLHLRTQDSQGMLLQHAHSEYRMLTHDADDFPEPPVFGGEQELSLTMGVLRDAIDSVIFAVSNDNHRPILTGVLFQGDGSTLTLVATDTHRLAVRKLSVDSPGAAELKAVVPERALKAIKALPLGDDDVVTISFGGGRLGVEAGGAKIVSQLLAGPYPNWERVVPSESTRKWIADIPELAQKLNRIMILAKDNASRVKFSGSGEVVLMSARSEEKGEAKEELTVVPENGDVEIAFNGAFIRDALKPMTGEGVRIEMTENSRPAIFKPVEGDSDYFCVIMPMAL